MSLKIYFIYISNSWYAVRVLFICITRKQKYIIFNVCVLDFCFRDLGYTEFPSFSIFSSEFKIHIGIELPVEEVHETRALSECSERRKPCDTIFH